MAVKMTFVRFFFWGGAEHIFGRDCPRPPWLRACCAVHGQRIFSANQSINQSWPKPRLMLISTRSSYTLNESIFVVIRIPGPETDNDACISSQTQRIQDLLWSNLRSTRSHKLLLRLCQSGA